MEAWGEIRELARIHEGSAGGRFQPLENTPEHQEVRTSLYLPGAPQTGEFIDDLAEGLEETYPAIAEEINQGAQGDFMDEIASAVNSGGKVVFNMNHAGLFRSGIGYRLPCKALEERGCSFDKAVIGSATLLNLKAQLIGKSQREKGLTEEEKASSYVPAYTGVSWISDHFFISIPPTERMKDSGLAAYKDEVSLHNEQMKGLLRKLLDGDEGVLILMLGSGTHDKPKEKDPSTMRMFPISDGTVDFVKDNELLVAEAAILDLPDRPMGFYLMSGPQKINTPEQMHENAAKKARLLGKKAVDVSFEYEGMSKA
jgi:hypothetical protein